MGLNPGALSLYVALAGQHTPARTQHSELESLTYPHCHLHIPHCHCYTPTHKLT